MDQDLRELTEQMRELIRVLQSNSGTGATTPKTSANTAGDKLVRSVDHMVVALAKLAAQLDTSKKTKLSEEEAIKKFTKSVEKTVEALDKEETERELATKKLQEETKAREEAIRKSKLTQKEQEQEAKEARAAAAKEAVAEAKKAAAERGKEARNYADEFKRTTSSSSALYDALSGAGTGTELFKTQLYNLAGSSLTAQVGLRAVGAISEGVGKSLKTFSTGLLSGERGATLTAKAFTDLATPILDFANVLSGIMTVGSFFLPGGPVLKFGLRAGAALLGLGSAAGKAGLALNELGAKQVDSLFKTFNGLSASGINLTSGLEGTLDLMHTLNMSTAEAAKFNELLGKSSKSLALMGGTAATGAERFAKVSGSLVKSDIGQTFENMGIAQDEQREAALLYMSIQAKTGQLQLKNTEQLIHESSKFVYELDQAAQLTGATRKEQQEAREAALAEVRFRAARIEAERRGDTAFKAQLDAAERAAALARSMGDVRGATGILQAGAGRGALATPEAIAAEQTYRISEIMARPNMTQQQMLKHMAASADANMEMLGPLNTITGQNDALQTDFQGMANMVQRQTVLADEAAKAGFTGPDAIGKYLDAEEAKRKKPGGSLDQMVQAGRAQQSAAMVMEKGIDMFTASASINKTASELFATNVEKFGKIMGVKVAGGTPTTGPTAMSTTALTGGGTQSQLEKVKQVENEALAANDRARALEKDANASKEEKEAAKQKARELEAQLAQEGRLLREAQLAEQNARRAQRRSPTGVVDNKLLEALSSGGISDKRAQANILAQVQAESGGVPKAENLNYSPERLMQMFPKKFASIEEATQVAAAGPESVGNKIYGGRMGNAPDEGFKYRGRGLIQLTGKDNYKKYGDIIGVDLVSKPDLANDPEIARKLAVAYFQEKQKAGVDLTKSSKVSEAVGHVDIGGAESRYRSSLADNIFSQLPKAADGGTFRGPKSGYPAVLHGDEAVIPLKNGAVPVMLPDDFIKSMSKLNFLTDLVGGKSNLAEIQNNIGQGFDAELEKIKSQVLESTNANNAVMAEMVKQMSDELRKQGEANRQIFENMLRGDDDTVTIKLLNDLVREQKTANDISQKILKTSY